VVSLRTREIGVRMAIGATPRDIARLLVRDGLRPVLMGAGAGIGIALVATRAIAALLYGGVSARDPIAFACAALILLSTAAMATAIPARRAARIDPAVTLREP
jgi:putative ABC transport system permease protein